MQARSTSLFYGFCFSNVLAYLLLKVRFVIASELKSPFHRVAAKFTSQTPKSFLEERRRIPDCAVEIDPKHSVRVSRRNKLRSENFGEKLLPGMSPLRPVSRPRCISKVPRYVYYV